MNGLYQIPGLFLTALCHVIVIFHMSERKYSSKKFVLYSGIYTLSFVILGGYGYAINVIAAIFLYMMIVVDTFLFSCIISRDCFPKKCFLFITYFCLFSVLDNIMKLMVKLFLPGLSVQAGYYVAIVLRSVVLMLVLLLYNKYAVAILRSIADNNRRRWWNLAVSALLCYLLQASLSVLNVRNVIPNVYLLLIFVVISLIMCAAYGLVFSNISYMKKEEEAALVRQNAEYLSSRLATQQNAEETHRRLRHDIRHHLEMIAEYAKAGDTSAVLAYIREYSIEISNTAIKQYSLNRTIDSILSVYAGKAEESNIDFSVNCNTPAELNVKDVDLIALLGNLLENALHGCWKSGKEKACIEVHIRRQNNRLIVVCNNTCPDGLKLSEGLPVGKGIGISSIQDVCRRYGGNLDYKIEGGVCSACVILN